MSRTEHWLGRIQIDTELQDDGRWMAKLPGYAGAIAYGNTEKEAVRYALAKAAGITLRAN